MYALVVQKMTYMKNPIKDRDLNKELRFPVISASSMNCWYFRSRDCNEEKARENWYQSYVLGNRSDPLTESGAIKAGKTIGEALTQDPSYLPEVPRPEIYEFTIPPIQFGACKITGHMDGFSPTTNNLLEYKTSQSKTYWNQKSVDENDQISFYYLLLLHKFKIHPTDIRARLVYIPVSQNGDFTVTRNNEPIQIFETKRSMLQVLLFGQKVQQTYREMCQYVDNYA